MLVYVIASKPYPEKVSNGRFYLILEDAERELLLMDARLQPYFRVYPAKIDVERQSVFEISK